LKALDRPPPSLAITAGAVQWRQQMNFGNLLYWAVVFLVIAVVAALFGFGGVAGTAMEGAKIIFWIAVVLFVISLLFGFMRRGP
jgi:uncharacterized membrane protein YtjA (UPF0391 family)